MSLRTRLLLAVGAVAVLALMAADVATYSALRSFLYQRVDQTLSASIGRTRGGFGAQVAPGMFGERLDADGSIILRAAASLRDGTTAMPKLPARIELPGDGAPRYFTSGAAAPGGPPFRVRAQLLPDGGSLVVALPLDDTVATLHRLLAIEVLVTVLALTAATGLGWWLVRVGLRPLADVEATAGAIAEGALDRRVPGDDASTEVGRLAAALNTMLARIEAAFAERNATLSELRRSEEQLRRFVADASHELRTPLAAVSAYAELFERGARERPADLDRVMAGIRAETARMHELVEDLLLLARLDEGRPLERESVDLVVVAAEAIEAAAAVGPQWPVRIEAGAPVEVTGDRARLRQVVDNLLANVRGHTPPGTSATLHISRTESDAELVVRDNGPGLSEDDLSRVFERFFRGDPSRVRQHDGEAGAGTGPGGGSGLGLSIVAAIVEAHGGRAAAANAAGGGALVTVTLPLAPEPPEPDESGTGQRNEASANPAAAAAAPATDVPSALRTASPTAPSAINSTVS